MPEAVTLGLDRVVVVVRVGFRALWTQWPDSNRCEFVAKINCLEGKKSSPKVIIGGELVIVCRKIDRLATVVAEPKQCVDLVCFLFICPRLPPLSIYTHCLEKNCGPRHSRRSRANSCYLTLVTFLSTAFGIFVTSCCGPK